MGISLLRFSADRLVSRRRRFGRLAWNSRQGMYSNLILVTSALPFRSRRRPDTGGFTLGGASRSRATIPRGNSSEVSLILGSAILYFGNGKVAGHGGFPSHQRLISRSSGGRGRDSARI